MSKTKQLKTDAEGRLEDIRISLTDAACCSSGDMACSFQLMPEDTWLDNPTGTVQLVCCGCGEPLVIDEDEEEE